MKNVPGVWTREVEMWPSETAVLASGVVVDVPPEAEMVACPAGGGGRVRPRKRGKTLG